MSVDDYRWHYDYARLAWDSGFTFQTHRSKPSLDKNIGHIDIEHVIRERDVGSIERHISTVIEFSLDNDQTSVLDPSFVKIFRLSQLSVQYLLFCKKYLDNTVVLIKKEFTKNNEETKNLKRYVDELKQEAANSKKQMKELKAALSCQIASTQNVPVFQCNKCPKAFSTEEYLLAHIKRRHELLKNVGTSSTSFQAETDKLQLEIKELKERLNNTEKFIHNDEPGKLTKDFSATSSLPIVNNSTDNIVLTELQQKFEILRNHVENELRILQTHKFDQEKYEKWFETFISKLEHSQTKKIDNVHNIPEVMGVGSGDTVTAPKNNWNEKSQPVVVEKLQQSELHNEKQKDINFKEHSSVVDIEVEVVKNDCTTQTDFAVSPERNICKNCQARHSPVFRTTHVKQANNNRGSFSDGENIQKKLLSETENHLEKFEEMLQEKVTGSIEKLENQMHSFWNKMNEIEMQKLQADSKDNKKLQNRSNTSIESIEIPQKVVPKPRKRILVPKEAFKSTTPGNLKESPLMIKPKPKEITKTIQIKLPKNPVEVITSKEAAVNSDSKSDTESETSEESTSSESESSEEEDTDNHSEVPAAIVKPSNTSTLGQRSLTSLKEVAFTPEVLQGLQKEVENILNSRLEELGVSPAWATLPVRSYQRALNIVTHQANLIQKNIANYMHIRGQILKDVDRQVLERKKGAISTEKHSRFKNLLNNVRNKAKVIVQNESKYSNKSVGVKTNAARSHPRQTKIRKARTLENIQNTKEEKPKPSPKMYTTDSESDANVKDKLTVWKQSKITDQTQKAYFDVIQELNTSVNMKTKDPEGSVSEISEILVTKEQNSHETLKKDAIEDDNHADIKTETQAKGVLKNYPSIGSLQKKKVLFDLESSESYNQKEPEKPAALGKTNDGGSTTSIASSVLDGSKTNLTQKNPEKKQNELSDVSDWDLSEILN